MTRLIAKLKAVKFKLQEWSRIHFSRISERTKIAQENLIRIQTEIQNRPLDLSLALLEIEATMEYRELCRQEEASLFQKVKQNNVTLGDGNNAYFHRLVQGRKNANTIRSVRTEDGNLHQDDTSIKNAFLHYYQALLAQEHESDLQSEDLNSFLFPQLGNQQELQDLARTVSKEEIKNALFDIDDNSAPGPDGFGSAFFK
ncbi:RNA-directed DNA polymerase (Reverse transcriptase), partial [Thalictrum thalictroides]